jgi:hypothetical protein
MVPAFVFKTDDDVVLNLRNLERRLLRILDEGQLLELYAERREEEEEGKHGRGKRRQRQQQPTKKKKKRRDGVDDDDEPWIYFGRPIPNSIFPGGSLYMQGSLYGFSRALAAGVAAATPNVAQVEAAERLMAARTEKRAGGGGEDEQEDERTRAVRASVATDADAAPLHGHEDYLASQWVLRAAAAAAKRAGGRGKAAAAHEVQWANATRPELHDTPLVASEFSQRVIDPRRVLAVHNVKHPLEFMHAYGGMVKGGV